MDWTKQEKAVELAQKEAIAALPAALEKLGPGITVKDLNRAAAFVAASLSEWCFPNGVRPAWDTLIRRSDAFTQKCEQVDKEEAERRELHRSMSNFGNE